MGRKLKLLLVEDDVALCNELKELVENTEDMVLTAITNDSYKALEYIKDTMPDVVILDLELNLGRGSGLHVLQELHTLSLSFSKKPYILVTTNNSSSMTYESVRRLGADYIMSKHQDGYSCKMVLDFLRIMAPTIQSNHHIVADISTTTGTAKQYTNRIRRRAMAELDHVGISPKSHGYTYLADAICLMAEQPTQNICTVLAEQYKKSEPSIERAMQNAINRAWETYDTEDLLHYYTAKINSDKGCPTITEFICYYANKLRNEYL